MEEFVQKLKADFPRITFSAGNGFYWSPKQQSVIYKEKGSVKDTCYTLLHEVAHAQLRHRRYSSDIELLNMEVAAWDKAIQLSEAYKIKIPDEHIQNCLDSYRNWLHQRSTCPTCQTHSLQKDVNYYQCFNCHSIWKVTSARFCRAYRRIEGQNKTSPEEVLPQVMFL